jgi:hypothetical protein
MIELKHKVLGSVGAPKENEHALTTEVMPEDDLRSLIELGCIRDKIKIGELTFVMKSLSASEQMSLAKSVVTETKDDPNKTFSFNVQLLAMSIETVNGKPLERFHPENFADAAGQIACKVDIITAMQTPVIFKLLEFYQEITDRCYKQFTAEQVKN